MAFNPFHKFRKHQKVIFAGLTIMCMLTFVLAGSTGVMSGGDFFSDVSRWFSGHIRQTDVANLYGKEVTEKEMLQLKAQRKMANQFMFMAVSFGYQNRTDKIRKTLGNTTDQRMIQAHVQGDAQAAVLNQLRFGMMFGQPFFEGGIRPEELLDFMIWRHEADRLGIYLTRADVVKEINRLVFDSFTAEDSVKIQQALGNVPEFRPFYTDDFLIKALTDELRVRMARAALTGNEPGTINKVASGTTPYEFWEFFKDQRTTVEVGLIPVKVADFVAQVKEEPTEAELKELYAKFKDKEYVPDSADPTFKQPRRVQIEWLSAKADAPYFVKQAEDVKTARRAALTVGAGFGNFASLSGPAVGGIEMAQPFGIDTAILKDYEYFRRFYKFRAPLWTQTWDWGGLLLHDSSVKQPANAAAAVGQAFGVVGTPAAALAPLMSFTSTATARETADRLKHGLTFLLTGAGPNALGTAAMVAAVTPKEEHLPLSQVKNWLMPNNDKPGEWVALDKLESRNDARKLRNYTLTAIRKEIAAIDKAKDKAMLEAYIAHVAKVYGLQTGKTAPISEEYANRFTLVEDPGLKELKAAYLLPPAKDRALKQYDEMFLRDTPLYAAELYPQSDSEWTSAEDAFLYWKVATKAAKIVPLDKSKAGQQVREEVTKAWKWRKARELAKKEAERLTNVAREKVADVARDARGDRRRQKLKDLSAELKTNLIELMPLARSNPKPAPNQYDPPRIPEDRVPHTGEDPMRPQMTPFAEKLVGLRDKAPGDAVVVADLPEEVFYVAALIEKQDPTESEFYSVYGSAGSANRDPRRGDTSMLGLFEQERQRKYLADYIERLRQEAKLDIHKENIKRLQETPGSSEE